MNRLQEAVVALALAVLAHLPADVPPDYGCEALPAPPWCVGR